MKKNILILLFALPFVMNAQMTYVPDDNFEQALIDLGYDTAPLNDSIPTKNIDTLSWLDVSKKSITDLTGIQDFKSLKALSCFQNNLLDLDLSKNTALKYLYCNSNALTSLDLSYNVALINLDCSSNNIVALDLSNNSALVSVLCVRNQLTSLDITKCSILERLSCSKNNLSKLDVSKNVKLERIICSYNELTSLDVSNNKLLTLLDCFFNQIISLDLSQNTSFFELHCGYNQLQTLNLKNGNNHEMKDFEFIFDARNNPNLFCIQVDDPTFSEKNSGWWKDSVAHYSTNCGSTDIYFSVNEYDSMYLSPNPATDFIEISCRGEVTSPLQSEVRIYNVFGQNVSTPNPTPALPASGEGVRIDVSGLAPGMYFVRVGDKVSKFVKI